MAARTIGGLIAIKVNGEVYKAVANFTFNQGLMMNTALIGATGVDGYTVAAQAAFLEGEIRDGSDVDLEALVKITDATVTADLANGKTFVLANSWYEGEGTGNTQESNFPFRFVSDQQGTFV